MLTVGVTGGVGSGKTTVSKMFEEEGAYLIDADQIGRELIHPGSPAWKELLRVFGRTILQKNGTIDRSQLANLVFSNRRKRRLLNNILHPRIRREMMKRAREIARKDTQAIVIFDVPLLVETGFHREMDKVVVVTSKETQQIRRLKKRAGLKEEEARRILSSQWDIEKKIKVADFVIPNEGPLKRTRTCVREVFQELKKLLDRKNGRSSVLSNPYKKGKPLRFSKA